MYIGIFKLKYYEFIIMNRLKCNFIYQKLSHLKLFLLILT